jgi:cullin-associated NEDD8-dissociated protein 1
MEKFISLLSDTDLEVRKASLLMINAALRHHGYVLNENLKENVIPRLFEALEFKLERTVDLGPFKHTVDDGLPLRKSALWGIESILDGFPGKLDLILFMPKLIACLVDKDELKMQAFQIIVKIRNFAPSVLVGCLDQFIEPFGKVISKKVAKEGQVGPEVERAIELQRNAVKTITIINNIEDASINRRWQDFVESIRQKEGISAMLTEIELEKNNDQF